MLGAVLIVTIKILAVSAAEILILLILFVKVLLSNLFLTSTRAF